MGNECGNRDNKERVSVVSTRFNDFVQTIRSTLWKNGERNLIANVERGGMRESLKSGKPSDYKYLGNLNGPHCHDGYHGAVFDISGLSPTVTTCQGGGREPHILLIRKHDG